MFQEHTNPTDSATLSLVRTQEGSHTLYHPQRKEHYHSLNGSLAECQHVFIRNGLLSLPKRKKEIRILEIGFGTGLNAILTYRENQVLQKNIHYTGVEAFPLPVKLTEKLNYFEYFGKPLQPVFREMHACPWMENIRFSTGDSGNFILHKMESDLLELRLDDSYDLIYYDAFSPSHQPELWSFDVLQKIYDACNRNAVLVTSCAKAEVKKTLSAIGFEVETLAGTSRTREMIRARK